MLERAVRRLPRALIRCDRYTDSVVPEVDLPAHTASWGKAFPSIVVPCIDPTDESPLHAQNRLMLDPTQNTTYDVIVGRTCGVDEAEVVR